MGDWLDELPLESGFLDEVAPEDQVDEQVFARALRSNRGELVLDVGSDWPIDKAEYDRTLRTERRGQKPPHLQQATGDKQCGGCAHFDNGICGLYTYAVNSSQVCDSFEPE